MAITASGKFYLTERDIQQNDTAIDMLVDSLKCALFTNTITPNFDTNTAYASAPFNANEVGTATAITTPTITVSSGTFIFDGDNTAFPSATFTGARGTLIYDDTITTPVADPAIMFINFGADFSVTSGILTIQWDPTGIWRHDLTP